MYSIAGIKISLRDYRVCVYNSYFINIFIISAMSMYYNKGNENYYIAEESSNLVRNKHSYCFLFNDIIFYFTIANCLSFYIMFSYS